MRTRLYGSALAGLPARVRMLDGVSVVIIVAATLLRIEWVLDSRVAPIDDAAFYYQHASELAAGNGYLHPATGHPSAFLPPGYPLVLAAVFVFTGPSVVAAGMLNAAVAAAGLIFTHLLARRYFGPAAGALAVAALALFPSQIIYTPAVMPDTLFTTLVIGALWAGLARPTIPGQPAPLRTILCGALLGAAILTAPKALLLLPALSIMWRADMPWRESARRTALAAAAMLVVVLPWSVRSTVALESPVFVSTNGGVNLWSGNHEGASGGWEPWQEGSKSWVAPADETATNRTYFARGLGYALQHPIQTVRLWPAKLDETFSQDFTYLGHFSLVPRDRPLEPGLENGVVESRVHTYYCVFIVLALVGSAVLLIARHEAGALGWPVAALVLPIVIFFGLDRFHVPLLPLLAVAMGGGAMVAMQRTREVLGRAPRAAHSRADTGA